MAGLNLTITIPEHDFRLIAVPGEFLTEPASNYTHIESKGKIYEVHKIITHKKGEMWSTALPLLSSGSNFSEAALFEKYNKSDKIVFFVCRLK